MSGVAEQFATRKYVGVAIFRMENSSLAHARLLNNFSGTNYSVYCLLARQNTPSLGRGVITAPTVKDEKLLNWRHTGTKTDGTSIFRAHS